MPKDNVIQLRPTRPCPICGKPSTQASFPFCSPRCADIDLNRWLSGAYVIPGKSAAEASDDGDEDDTTLPSPSDDGDE
jgi:endogenous inhibitor of DNA gyrase (YacG/DUF329 family)